MTRNAGQAWLGAAGPTCLSEKSGSFYKDYTDLLADLIFASGA